jgi:uncharacterized protein
MRLSRIICLIIGSLLLNLAANSDAGLWSETQKPPSRIALLLPLRGVYGESAQALRDGFLAAYYQSLPQDPSAPTVRIVDTTDADVVALYRQAVEQGVDMVVGPLSKEQGMQLVQAGVMTVPTLVLNNLAVAEPAANLYQLGLAPEDEVRQVTAKAWGDGKRNALIIVPANAWGQRVSQVFVSTWQELGGKLVAEMFYDDPRQLSAQVAQILQVAQSEKRAKELQRQLMQPKMRTIPYRRQDLDMIFLAAKPELGRQIRPLLNFYYAGKIPVYSTSHIYSGSLNPQVDQDLNNVKFCAIPWEIAPQTLSPDIQSILHTIEKAWPQAAQKQPQFFALGVDSYRLARQISSGAVSPQMNGATGQLTLESNHVWARQLPWAEMIKGQPQLIP